MSNKSNQPPSEVRAISREVNRLVDNAFSVDTDQDKDIVNDIKVTWDDLVGLKDELASQVLNLVHNVTSITANTQITDNLTNPAHFQKLVEVFFQDVNEYSSKVKALRGKHEHHTGKIMSVAEFEEYNKLAVEYYGLSEELIHILAPTVTELVLISNADVTAKINAMEPANVQPI